MFNAIAKLRMRIASAEPLDAASEEFARFARFGVAGLANTVVGFGIIAALDIGMHVRPVSFVAGGQQKPPVRAS
jgi:hypothetical protein